MVCNCGQPNGKCECAAVFTPRATETEPVTRHKSQQRVLDLIDAMRDAVESLPLDANVWWYGDSCSVFIDEPLFRDKFRGQKVLQDIVNGVLSIVVDGVTYSTIIGSPKVAKEEVVL